MTTPSTKDRLLDAAEALFAESGYAGTSLRAITGAAGVNLAAAHYHFGGKLALYQAVFERRVDDLNAERLRRLDALEALESAGGGARRASLEDVLRAFLEPAIQRAVQRDEGWARFARLVARMQMETGEELAAVRDVFREVQLRFFPAFHQRLPHLDEAGLFWRMHFFVGAMCQLLADPRKVEVFSEGRCDGTDAEQATSQLVAFASGALRAPAAAPEQAESPSRGGGA